MPQKSAGPSSKAGDTSSCKESTTKCKFHTQEKSNSCVVASSRNIIKEKTGKDISESELREEIKKIMGKPNHDFEKNGISPKHAMKLLENHGVENTSKKGLSLGDLEKETKNGPVMIGFKNPGHRVILDSVKKDKNGTRTFIVKDPGRQYKGKPREMSEADFKKKYNDKAITIIPDD